jgi:hypothetical protein
LIAFGEYSAGVKACGIDADRAFEDQLRRVMICTLASFIAQLSDPMAGTSSPWESEGPLFSTHALAIRQTQ